MWEWVPLGGQNFSEESGKSKDAFNTNIPLNFTHHTNLASRHAIHHSRRHHTLKAID